MLKFTRKTVIMGSIVVAVVVVIVLAVTLGGSKVSYDTAVGERGSVTDIISVTGSISPLSKIELKPEVSGRAVKIPMKAGDQVKEGDVLLKIDSRDIEARVAAQRAAVDSAKAQLSALEKGATAEDLKVSQAAVDAAKAQYDAAVSSESDATVALANAERSQEAAVAKADTLVKSKVDSLLADFDDAVTTSSDVINRLTYQMFTPDDFLTFTSSDSQAVLNATSSRKTAKTAITGIQSAVNTAKAAGTAEAVEAAYATVAAGLGEIKKHVDHDSAVLNYAVGLASATLSSYQLNVSTAQSSLNTIIAKLTSDKNSLDLQENYNTTDLTAAQTAVDNAEAAQNAAKRNIETTKAAWAQAEANYELKKAGVRQETVDAQRASVAAAQATLNGLYADLAKYTIAAPLDAIVTDINYELGETVQMGQVAVTLNTEGKFEIISNISEVDIAKIKVGDRVDITLDAFSSDEAWTGKVVDVQPAEKVVEGVIFYETKVVFDEDDSRLKSGMTANLDIETARVDDAVRVPVRAVKEKSGNSYVQVVVNGRASDREVEVGLEGIDYIEIKSGLEAGESVVISVNGKK
jgi:HlyD family secretion protein